MGPGLSTVRRALLWFAALAAAAATAVAAGSLTMLLAFTPITGGEYRGESDVLVISASDFAPPPHLRSWLGWMAVEFALLGVVVFALPLVATLEGGSAGEKGARARRPYLTTAFWVWSSGVLLMSIFFAGVHIHNWRDWPTVLGDFARNPDLTEPLQGPLGGLAIVAIGSIPIAIAWRARRRRNPQAAL